VVHGTAVRRCPNPFSTHTLQRFKRGSCRKLLEGRCQEENEIETESSRRGGEDKRENSMQCMHEKREARSERAPKNA
jgi:hypothetical protein